MVSRDRRRINLAVTNPSSIASTEAGTRNAATGNEPSDACGAASSGSAGRPPLVRTAATLRRWRVELLNYRRYPLTNALVEDKHNRVKALKRRAYGHRNQRTFLVRILNLVHTD